VLAALRAVVQANPGRIGAPALYRVVRFTYRQVVAAPLVIARAVRTLLSR
jgi:hypothetical protein